MKITPIRDNIVAKRIEERDEKKVGSIIIPDTAKEKPMTAEVIAIGSGRTLKDGKKVCARREGGRQSAHRQVLGLGSETGRN